jgi:hypothetical protein
MIPFFFLPFETRQVSANLEGNRCLASRYLYVDNGFQIPLLQPKGAYSEDFLKKFLVLFLSWANTFSFHKNIDLYQCNPYDICLFLQRQGQLCPFIVEQSLTFMRGMAHGGFSFLSEMLTPPMVDTIRMMGALQSATWSAQPPFIQEKCFEYFEKAFPDRDGKHFGDIAVEWQGAVLACVLIEELEKKIPPHASDLERIARALFLKNPSGGMEEDLRNIFIFYDVPYTELGLILGQFYTSVEHFIAHEDSHSILREVSEVMTLLEMVSALRMGNLVPLTCSPAFIEKVYDFLKKKKRLSEAENMNMTGQIVHQINMTHNTP